MQTNRQRKRMAGIQIQRRRGEKHGKKEEQKEKKEK